MIDAKFELFSELLDEVARVRGRIPGLFAPVNAETGLSDIEMTVLNAVAEATTPPTVPRIGRSLGHPRQVIQRAANAMVARGLIATASNPDHKRALLLVMTADGRRLKQKADTIACTIAQPVIANLDPAALKVAARALHDIRISIEVNARAQTDVAGVPMTNSEGARA